MGLNITAYKTVTLKTAMTLDEYNRDKEAQRLCDQPGIVGLWNPDRADQSDGMREGLYSFQADDGWHARTSLGSYHPHNAYRARLATTMCGRSAEEIWKTPWVSMKGVPFIELIDFSDCQGFIGPKTSAKLARDFEEHAHKLPTDDPAFVEWYQVFAKAFALAANGGVVKFH